MILFVSGRTDVVAFYWEWFMKRYQVGKLLVRNPFNRHLLSEINFSDVDAILFCTKNPLNLLKDIDKINIPKVVHVTLTPYLNDIEPNVIDKKEILEAIKKLSLIIGADNIYVRYDPIFISDKYTLEYHQLAFSKLCRELNGYVKHYVISFLDEYKNVVANKDILRYKQMTNNDYIVIGSSFGKCAKENNATIQTCFENSTLEEFGFIRNDCMNKELASSLTGKVKFKKSNVRKGGKCNCVSMVDIGDYNSCLHLCKYCYANYNENDVLDNNKTHNPDSPLLIGDVLSDDIIKKRVN